MLLGASISFAAILASGPVLLAAIVATVVVTIAASFTISRVLGLSVRMSILIACGNAICGNSAIAAVAPVIGAGSDDVASSISFTAILGVLMVLGLPLLIPLLGLGAGQYGILAGLTVYAVPQVLAATVPAGLISTQIGTLVKLMRVLMLGPVVVGLSLVASRWQSNAKKTNVGFFRLVPWFILGFLALATMRSLEIVPPTVVGPVTKITSFLTVVSMAALVWGGDGVLGPNGRDVLGDVPAEFPTNVALWIGVLTYVPILWLAYRTFFGGVWARLIMIALVTLSQASQMWQYLQGTRPTFGALLSLSVDLLVVYALTSLSARDWVEQGLVEGEGAAA